jgi:hypothetical protein
MSSRSLSIALVTLALAACSPADDDVLVAIEEVPSPAGPQSGEPFVSIDGDGVLMSWLERNGEGHDLRFARYDGTAWSEPVTIEHRTDFFVNWADFPSVRPGPGGTLWAHWLQRGEAGGYDYAVRIARSDDGGASWADPWTLHDDDSPTEHGFLSAFVKGDDVGFVWLDGRKNDPERLAALGQDAGEMTLRYRSVSASGAPGEEVLLDGRVCDCCQTASAVTDNGPVVIYRNRSDAEIRDIYVTRAVGETWTAGVPVHEDNWEIGGCPVNGPAIAAAGQRVAVAWFTAPDNVARAKVAFSDDAGATFGDPVTIDDGNPAGRVDVALLEDGSALVTWVERTGGDGAEVRMRIVDTEAGAGESHALTGTTSTRPSGFPRMATLGENTFLMAWTDVTSDEPRVRVEQVEMIR